MAKRIYRAGSVSIFAAAMAQLKAFEAMGYGHLPVCMAKTQTSFSADPALLGAPTGHVLPVREVRLAAGAGFVVAICGDLMTMPGLPRAPAAERIHLNADGDNRRPVLGRETLEPVRQLPDQGIIDIGDGNAQEALLPRPEAGARQGEHAPLLRQSLHDLRGVHSLTWVLA